MNKKDLKYLIINNRVSAFLLYHFLRFYLRTLKVGIENEETLLRHLEKGGTVIIACWHQRFFGGFGFPRRLGQPIPIVMSMSRDGEFIANIMKFFGWVPVRGSSSRGGTRALREIIKALRKYRIGVHIVDGPTGPPRIVKPGLVYIAAKSEAAICPVYVRYGSCWIFNSWDRFMVPKPFSRISIRLDSLHFIPADINSKELEQIRSAIETQMTEAYQGGA